MSRQVLLSWLLGVAALATLLGCGQGPSDQDIKRRSEAWKIYNQHRLKDSPLPEGEGPGD